MNKVEKRKQEILGWYHSHPYFEAKPSKIDTKNHENYQEMFKKDNKQFIGSIVSPYFTNKISKQSTEASEASFRSLCQTLCFQNEKNGTPYDLNFKLLPESSIKKRVYE